MAGSSPRSSRLSTWPGDQRERRPQLVRDSGQEARPELLGRTLGAQVAQHDHGARAGPRHRREGGRDGYLRAIRAAQPCSSVSTRPDGSASTSSNRHRGPQRGRSPSRARSSGPRHSAARRSTGPRPVAPARRGARRPPGSPGPPGVARPRPRCPRVAPSRIAARRACSPASSSRSWAARNAMASSWRTSARRRIRSGRQRPAVRGPERQEPHDLRPERPVAQVPPLVERHAVPAVAGDPRPGHAHRHEPAGDDARGQVALLAGRPHEIANRPAGGTARARHQVRLRGGEPELPVLPERRARSRPPRHRWPGPAPR